MASPPERGMSGLRTAGVPVMDEHWVRLKLIHWETEKNYWDRARRLNPSVGNDIAKISQSREDNMQLPKRNGVTKERKVTLHPSSQAGVVGGGDAALGAGAGGEPEAALERGMSGVRRAEVPVMDKPMGQLKPNYQEREKNPRDRAEGARAFLGSDVARKLQSREDTMQLPKRNGVTKERKVTMHPSSQAGVVGGGGAALGAGAGGEPEAALERGMSGVRRAGVPVMDEPVGQLKPNYQEREKYPRDRAEGARTFLGSGVAKISQMVKIIMQLLERVAEATEMKVTIQQSFHAGLLGGGGAVLGALVGGPVGAAVGGAIGSVTATWMSGGKFKSIPEILKMLSRDKLEELCRNIYAVLKDPVWTSAEHLIRLVLSDACLLNLVKAELASFLIKQLKCTVLY